MPEQLVRRQDPSNLVWIDLEMTGLDPSHDVILQAALIVTDKHLNPLESFVTDIWQPQAALDAMVPFVREMHAKTGLLGRVASCRTEVRRAEQQLLERISGWCPYRPVLCGNTIHSDRKFLDAYMPALAGYLHYRMVDVSSLKVLAGLWLPSTQLYAKPEGGQHDALFDIQQSIAELAHYRRVMMPALTEG
ncbi:MAG TPA: oligoribonuclease [Polyangiaceae bacterium]|nr:oligoribonuclease [Polyangiaceae bacterium]